MKFVSIEDTNWYFIKMKRWTDLFEFIILFLETELWLS
jgi:hypothetical protein